MIRILPAAMSETSATSPCSSDSIAPSMSEGEEGNGGRRERKRREEGSGRGREEGRERD